MEQPLEERLFQAALGLGREDREAFIRNAAGDDKTLLDAVLLLLEGWEESGGDRAEATLGEGPTAWTSVAVEEPGTVIGHFRLLQMRGEGGMGTVWEAEQTEPVKRKVAIKVIKLGMDTVEVVKRFERERQTLALMNHPNIAQVYEAGATAIGRPYFAMELVAGEPITTHCDTVSLTLRQRLELFIAVCAGIEHAHQKGVIHRDLKPSNILVADGAPKVIDFGIAKATQEADRQDSLFTKQTQLLGTPAYMSPEQAASDGLDIDTRTDVYSLGVVLYEMLCGELPFDAARLQASGLAGIQRILTEEVPWRPSTRITEKRHGESAQDLRSHLRGDLDWVVMKALEKERDRRYASAADLASDLRRFLNGEAVSAAPPSKVYQLRKSVHKHRVAVGAATLVVLALALGLLMSLVQTRRANRALRGEALALHRANMTVVDLYTRSGFVEADSGNKDRAALWFANAAALAEGDPQREEASRLRRATWHQEFSSPVRVLDTGESYAKRLYWQPQGEAIIVVSHPRDQAQVWDLETETRWAPLANATTIHAAWSPDGDALVISDGSMLIVLDYPTGTERARLAMEAANRLDWSPDGRFIAVGSNSACLWEWQIDRCHPFPEETSGRHPSFHFSPEGTSLLVIWNGMVSVLEEEFTRFRFEPVPSHGKVDPGWVGMDRFYVIGPNADLEIRDARTGEIVQRGPGWVDDAADYMAVSPDGRFLVQKHGVAWDLSAGLAPFPRHDGTFRARAFSSDGTKLATGGYDQRLHLWSVPDGALLESIGHPNSALIFTAFSPDGRFLAASENGLVCIFRIASPPPLSYRLPVETTSLAKLSADGSLLVPSGYSHLSAQLTWTQPYAVASGEPLGEKIAVGGLLMDVAIASDNAWIAVAVSTTPDRVNAPFNRQSGQGGTGFIRLVDPFTGTWKSTAFMMPSEPRGVCVHPNGRLLGVCCAAGEGVEIDLDTAEMTVLFDNEEISHPHEWANNGRCRYTPDGRLFAVWGLYKHLHLWDREEARHLIEPFRLGHFPDLDMSGGIVSSVWVAQENYLEFHGENGDSVRAPILYNSNPWLGRFDPTGQHFLTGGTGKAAEVWDWRAGKRLGPSLPHKGIVVAGAFLPHRGQTWCATGGFEGSVRFWDYTSGMALRPPITMMPENGVLEMLLAPDENHLVVCSAQGIDVVDLSKALPASELDTEAALLLAEIEASAEVHPGGGLVPLTDVDWLEKWRAFRQAHPEYPGHRLKP